MIFSLISCDLSCSSIFLQGAPGSGKSAAARHYGSFRKFHNRIPILSISCNSDLTFDYFVGNYSLKNSEFTFVEGPLLIAIKNGEPILFDEINLCTEEILINLLPLLKANVYDYIQLKGVPYSVQIKPGFLFIATGNADNELGRKKIPKIISDEFTRAEIKEPKFDQNSKLLNTIIEKEFKECVDKKLITVEQISKIIKVIETIGQYKISLRQIKCLLRRIKNFCLESNEDLKNYENVYKEIPVIYVIIGYFIPGLKIVGEKLLKLIEKFNSIMNYNNLNELNEFIKSPVELIQIKNNISSTKNYIQKGKICLRTFLKNEEFPQIIMQIYFWIRMSCSLRSDTPNEENGETLLLTGPTSYKGFLLNKWLSNLNSRDFFETHILTKNTETQHLIGNSTLDDKEKLSEHIEFLIDKALISNSQNIDDLTYKEKMEKLEELNNSENLEYKYIYKCIIKLEELKEKISDNDINTITSFILGFVSCALLFGIKLIVKGIDQPLASVIERINPILEYPRHLVLTEDTQEIFNNKQILSEIYGENQNKRNIPISKKFSIFFTSRESFNGRLSEAFRSRCTIINCPNYDTSNYLTIEMDSKQNYHDIAKYIFKKEYDTIVEMIIKIFDLNKNIPHSRKINMLSFIRWCNSAKNIYEYLDDNNKKFTAGIAALRSIFDGYEPNNRDYFIKNLLKDYLPESLKNLLIKNEDNNEEDNSLQNNPLEIIKIEEKLYVKSKISGIRIRVFNKINENSLEKIYWTNSTIDMVDSIITALASNAMLIFEGPPGRGKTEIAMSIFKYLNIEIKRINLSPSTSKEDIFSRTIPVIDNKKIRTEKKKVNYYIF